MRKTSLLALLILVIVSFGIAGGCSDSDGDNNGGGNPQPTPAPTPSPTLVPPTPAPTPAPTFVPPTPAPSPAPTPSPGGSILQPGGTLSAVAQSFDYVGDGNARQFLDYYPITNLPVPASAESRGANPVRPAIVFIHGGAWLAGDKEDVLDEPVILDAAEQAGFHLISVGYRLAGIAPDTAPWPAQIHDVNAAIRWIKQNAAMLDVDPERLVLVGGSAGAHIAAAAAYGSDVNELQGPENLVPPTQTDVALAFLIFGAYDMNMISQDGFDLVDDGTCNVLDLVGITAVVVLLDCGFSLEVDPLAGCSQDALDSASPVMNVDSSDPPSYLVHGRDDCVVPYLQTVGMESALNIAGVTNETMIVADGVHDSMSLMLDVEGILEFIDDNMEP